MMKAIYYNIMANMPDENLFSMAGGQMVAKQRGLCKCDIFSKTE